MKLNTVEDTRAFGERLAKFLRGGDCLALVGDLGAGKTTFVQGLAWGLGLPRSELAPSPTYAIALTYPTTPILNHIDLYRIGDRAETLLSEDYFASDAITIVEWPERAPLWLPSEHFRLELTRNDDETRTAILTASGCLGSRLASLQIDKV
jgi:tRNA threonylcarbamoyladenosine biosynthesis protein TsaE